MDNIIEQAVAPCPEIIMIIKGQKVRALLDMGSQVTLMNESYFLQNIEPFLTVDKDHLNAHKLFNLKGVEDGCVPLTKYFLVDIQVSGRLAHDIGILIKKDNIPLTDSKGRSTRAPAILGCNLIQKGMEEFIRDHGEMCLKLFECPAEWTHCISAHMCVLLHWTPKGHWPSKRKSQKGCQHKLNGGGGWPAGQMPIWKYKWVHSTKYNQLF